jgi:hypothetical protein
MIGGIPHDDMNLLKAVFCSGLLVGMIVMLVIFSIFGNW